MTTDILDDGRSQDMNGPSNYGPSIIRLTP